VAGDLRQARIPATDAFAVFLDDPSVVVADKLRSKVGYLVAAGTNVPASLPAEDIVGRKVVRATFKGSALVGSYKAYQAMKEWAREHDYVIALPALEIHCGEGWVEYQLPASKPNASQSPAH